VQVYVVRVCKVELNQSQSIVRTGNLLYEIGKVILAKVPPVDRIGMYLVAVDIENAVSVFGKV